MTLFLSKNRDMPTLSLKGSVCVPLFLFVLALSQLITAPLFAQDLRNRTEEMYPFGKIIISSESLPDKVYEAQKNKILISVVFLEKGTSNIITNSVGTGYVSETAGVIVTARHLLMEIIPEMEKVKAEKRKTNPLFDYEYVFMGTLITSSAWTNFPLYLVAIGEQGTLKDMMVLKTDVATMEKARRIGNFANPNPYAILLKTSRFSDAKVDGSRVYISGFGPVTAGYFDKNNRPVSVFVDLINHTFSAEIEALLPEMPENKTGVKIMYRLRDSAEPGFSGGKVMNDQGQVIGMTIAVSISKNFVFVISSKDIKEFLKDNGLK